MATAPVPVPGGRKRKVTSRHPSPAYTAAGRNAMRSRGKPVSTASPQKRTCPATR